MPDPDATSITPEGGTMDKLNALIARLRAVVKR